MLLYLLFFLEEMAMQTLIEIDVLNMGLKLDKKKGFINTYFMSWPQ